MYVPRLGLSTPRNNAEVADIVLVMGLTVDPATIRHFKLPLNDDVPCIEGLVPRVFLFFVETNLR